jgi:hypothetical protein
LAEMDALGPIERLTSKILMFILLFHRWLIVAEYNNEIGRTTV